MTPDYFSVEWPMTYRTWLVLSVFIGLLANQSRADIESQMTQEEFVAAGLNKLTKAELAALSDWLARQSTVSPPDDHKTSITAPIEAPAQASPSPRQPPAWQQKSQQEPKLYVSTIQGDFDGWSGNTEFRLDNGQVWRQRTDGRYRYEGPQPVEVELKQGFLGFWRLYVVGSDRDVGVKRIR